MFRDDPDLNRRRQEFFERFHLGSHDADPWHARSRQYVHKITHDWVLELNHQKDCRLLNAGSGGSDYGIPVSMVHYDLVVLPSIPTGRFIQGDVEQMPFSDASFNVVLCVGSVLNYCDPTRCLSEISRVLAPDGLVILEYERSGSAEYIWQRGFASAAARFVTFFGEETTHIWAYSDRFINGIIAVNGLKIVRSQWFHCLSALALAVLRHPTWSNYLAGTDPMISKLPIFQAISSNRILVAKKVAQDT